MFFFSDKPVPMFETADCCFLRIFGCLSPKAGIENLHTIKVYPQTGHWDSYIFVPCVLFHWWNFCDAHTCRWCVTVPPCFSVCLYFSNLETRRLSFWTFCDARMQDLCRQRQDGTIGAQTNVHDLWLRSDAYSKESEWMKKATLEAANVPCLSAIFQQHLHCLLIQFQQNVSAWKLLHRSWVLSKLFPLLLLHWTFSLTCATRKHWCWNWPKQAFTGFYRVFRRHGWVKFLLE